MNPTLTVDAIYTQTEHLSAQEKLRLIEKLVSSLRTESPENSPSKHERHIIGLFAGEGEMWMADDFDAPLPDAFWFGEDEGNE